MAAGVHAYYTVERAIEDWLDHGTGNVSQATVENYRHASKPILEHIGGKPLAKLTATDVRRALVATAETRSSRTVKLSHSVLTRAIAMAKANDLVARNVSELAQRPEGKAPGRESKAMTLDVALQLIRRCMLELDPDVELETRSPVTAAYTVLSWSTGIRTEEARALRWSEVDLEDATVSIIRSARSGGRTKTEGSRRTLGLLPTAVSALRSWQEQQAVTDGHVFTTRDGGPIDHHNMQEQFRRLCKRAAIGDKWVPRELRHSFVSAASLQGVSIEQISYLAGHSNTTITQTVYRDELRPALREGAKALGELTSGL